MAAQDVRKRAARDVPHAQDRILSCAEELAPVARKCQIRDFVAARVDYSGLRGAGIPEADAVIPASRRDDRAIWRKRDGLDRVVMPLEHMELAPGQIPYPRGSVDADRADARAIRRKGDSH